MTNILDKLFNGYMNYPVIIGVTIFCIYAIIAPPIIKLLFNKIK